MIWGSAGLLPTAVSAEPSYATPVGQPPGPQALTQIPRCVEMGGTVRAVHRVAARFPGVQGPRCPSAGARGGAVGAEVLPVSLPAGSRGTERTVVMDKSKGEPVISVKTASRSKERVSACCFRSASCRPTGRVGSGQSVG